MDTVELSKALASLPLTVLLLLVLIGGYVEWWIYGSLHRKQIGAMEKQITELKESIAELRESHEKIVAELRQDIIRWESRAFEREWDGTTERRTKT